MSDAATTPIFIPGLDPDGPIRKGHLKLFHKKSRTGCQRCRTRRVKCDETKPICRKCQLQGVSCLYDRQDPRSLASSHKPIAAAPQQEPRDADFFRPADADGNANQGSRSPESAGELSETRQRRIQELELLHFYITETGPSIAFDKNTSYDLYVKAIPRMAFKSDALLYSVYAFATLHQTKTTGGEDPSIPSHTSIAAARDRHRLYIQLAFQHHHRELAQLSRDNVDMLIMTASLMRLIAFVVLSERSLVPYTPPLEWLRMTESHARLFHAAWDLVGDNSSTQTARLIQSTPVVWDDDEREGANNRQGLQHILLARGDGDGHNEDDPNAWDAAVRRAYESALSYIGGVWQSIQRNDPLGPIGRRLMVFPLLVDKRFIELVGEARPRALVVMAHYFALVVILKSFWFIGNTGRREVRAIAAHLPAHWQDLMEWPLRIVDDGGLAYSFAAVS
ncbi:Sterol regulatory element-binding protein ECM22 [Tolypocladium ophioglossoides CBS 100239]|uniref:Sterol regulatory element-binding protein ECM22 n=1 Tax=Tolypocladium ophioglossoides (strain CBS 100239) TaxID=1163406 RepID=A0A0L0MZ65_TOLOC|nr:Sterol regulatory element-binding protein ECM22 [Tolypocladium ophioglossoides CBS 100239]